jgi:hypothetical protein
MVSMLCFVDVLLVVCPISMFVPSEISYNLVYQSNSAIAPRASSISTVGSNLNMNIFLCTFSSKSCPKDYLPQTQYHVLKPHNKASTLHQLRSLNQ